MLPWQLQLLLLLLLFLLQLLLQLLHLLLLVVLMLTLMVLWASLRPQRKGCSCAAHCKAVTSSEGLH